MNIDTIMEIIIVIGIIIGIISFIIWYFSKNEKISKFFKKIAEGIGEIISH